MLIWSTLFREYFFLFLLIELFFFKCKARRIFVFRFDSEIVCLSLLVDKVKVKHFFNEMYRMIPSVTRQIIHKRYITHDGVRISVLMCRMILTKVYSVWRDWLLLCTNYENFSFLFLLFVTITLLYHHM